MSTQRSSSSSSLLTAESAPQCKHDVFLSFRGADTRKGFVSHLYDELQYWQAIKTFKDDKDLDVGASITLELLSAIEQSHLAVVVLSPNYATSGWCLDELTKIFKTMETRDDTILPVFFHVDPCDVRYQKGTFAQAFTKHEERYGADTDKLKRWRGALTKVASLSGWDLKNYESERELIKVIVKCVWNKVRPTITLSHSTNKLVGIDFRLVEFGNLLAPEENDVRFIGLWGMGGIGKTTLAKLVFERISHHFEVSKFLLNVREVSLKHGSLVDLQKQLLSPILKENFAQLWDEQEGASFIRRCLSNKKVLLIVDDVDHCRQLEILVGNKSWFGNGSRIIITTRDKRLLVEQDIDRSYEVEGLDPSKSLELFSQNAFRKDEPEVDFVKMSESFVDYAKGLPLALKVLGRSLYRRDLGAWNSALDKLKKIPIPTIFDTLKLSYDSLDKMEKSILLDIAFFYTGMNRVRVIHILETSGFSGSIGLDVLIEKSLLTVGEVNNVEIHDLIKEMAWEIVRQESEDPGLRSRLCHREDIFDLFMKNTGTISIEGIRLCLPELKEADSTWNYESLSKMLSLRHLEINNLVTKSGPKFLPNSLRVLRWSRYPSKFLPESYSPKLLTELKMENSKIVQLWDGRLDLPKLKHMYLRNSKNLIKTPDVTGIPNLEKLGLGGCTHLVNIHPSVAIHRRLKYLDLAGCKRIKSLPNEIDMDSLEQFGLFGCSKLYKVPEFGSRMKNLSRLVLCGTAIEKLPSSIRHLVGLVDLELNGCNNLVSLPSSMADNLKFLKLLDVTACSKLEKLPENLEKMESLETLLIYGTAITDPPLTRNLRKLEFSTSPIKKLDVGVWGLLFGRKSKEPLRLVLPTSLRDLRALKSLNLNDYNLGEGDLPDDIGHCMPCLEILDLSGNNFVSLPTSIRFLSKLIFIELNRCKRLQQLPDLPSNSRLLVNADDCASLNRLSEPSLLNTSSTNLFGGSFSFVNCYGLVDNEGWNDGLLSILRRLAAQGISPKFEKFDIISPGSQIPGWFCNQIEGDSLTLELPPDSCSRWMGIAFCAVTADLGNPVAFMCDYLKIECILNGNTCNFFGLKVTGHFLGAHTCIFYMSRETIQDFLSYYNYDKIWLTEKTNMVFSFKTSYTSFGKDIFLSMKKCGARLVCEQDLEELLHYTENKLERTREYYVQAAGPSGSHGSSTKESLFKRLRGTLMSSCLMLIILSVFFIVYHG